MKKKIGNYKAIIMAMILAVGTAGSAAASSRGEVSSETEQETEQETELMLEKPGIMYLTDTVRVHEGPDKESKTIAFCDRGGSVSVLGIFGNYYHVRLDDPAQNLEMTETTGVPATEAQETESTAEEGYIYSEFLTESPEEAQAAVEANNAEIARKQAAAAAAAAAAASGSGNVVSRQKIEDCDGGGGTIITTYSDGSTYISRY